MFVTCLTYQLNAFICPGSQSLIETFIFFFFFLVQGDVPVLIFSNECYFSPKIYVASIPLNSILLPAILSILEYFLKFYIFKTADRCWGNIFRVFFAFNKKQTEYLIKHSSQLKLALKYATLKEVENVIFMRLGNLNQT